MEHVKTSFTCRGKELPAAGPGSLGDYKAAFWLGDRDAVFFRRLKPESYRFLSVADGFSARVPVRHAAGQLRNIDNEGVIFAAPPDDHFVTRILHRLKQFILCQDFAHLSYLIGLGLRTFTLQVDPLNDAGFGENMMAARDSHAKAFRLQQIADFVEPNVSIGCAAKKFLKSFFNAHGLA